MSAKSTYQYIRGGGPIETGRHLTWVGCRDKTTYHLVDISTPTAPGEDARYGNVQIPGYRDVSSGRIISEKSDFRYPRRYAP